MTSSRLKKKKKKTGKKTNVFFLLSNTRVGASPERAAWLESTSVQTLVPARPPSTRARSSAHVPMRFNPVLTLPPPHPLPQCRGGGGEIDKYINKQ